MTRRRIIPRSRIFLGSLLLILAVTSLVRGDDRFAIAIGPKDTLVVLGSKGEHVADFSAPTISQPVIVNGISFLVSYGLNSNNLYSAILTPNPDAPQDLHFSVLHKTVDAEKGAVITLTFSGAMSHVQVDPGYIGVVHVNARLIPHHGLNDSM